MADEGTQRADGAKVSLRDKVRPALWEIARRYDGDNDDVLQPYEIYCLLLAFFGRNYGTTAVRPAVDMFGTESPHSAEWRTPIDQVHVGHMKEFQGASAKALTIKGVAEFCIDTILSLDGSFSATEVVTGFERHGYNCHEGNFLLENTCARPKPQTHDTLILGLSDTDYSLDMDIWNCCHEFHIRPGPAALAKFASHNSSEKFCSTVTKWDDLEFNWKVDAKVEAL
ncbi:hypothetical protein Pelo_13055 [Pelomyxa schiedti]|nr:hypothetical protein Pelo_13055 [Pelomyxa schiedti]